MVIKILVKEIPWETAEKNSFQEISVPWKQMLGINKKAIFTIRKYLPTQSMRSNCSENPCWSHFGIEFS